MEQKYKKKKVKGIEKQKQKGCINVYRSNISIHIVHNVIMHAPYMYIQFVLLSMNY